MRFIPLTQGQIALVDDADYERLNQFKWYAQWSRYTKSFYAVRSSPRTGGGQRRVYMAREIMGLEYEDKRQVDHIHHNTLDNRKSELRICSHAENQHNRTSLRRCSSIFKGISWHKQRQKWVARISLNGQEIYLGQFDNELDAARAYDFAVRTHHKEFALTNFESVTFEVMI